MTSKIAEGLWRWTAPHPEWTPDKDKPGGWGRMVGSVYYEPIEYASAPILLIDPIDADGLQTALDRDLERTRRPVVILIGNVYHRRHAKEIRERLAKRTDCSIQAHPDFGTPGSLGGVEALSLGALDLDETAFFIRPHKALVFSDAVLGAGDGRLAVAPESWAAKGEAAAKRYRERFRLSLERLLDLGPEIVLPSHGEPVLSRGREALAAAIGGPAWGE
jgi:glyoxylase-like metal-dependent hydrolase (beta-lactamase superfamily II)